jgi:hypothetical protein
VRDSKGYRRPRSVGETASFRRFVVCTEELEEAAQTSDTGGEFTTSVVRAG